MIETPHIAIVDDDISVLRAITRMVTSENMEASVFSRADAFLKAFASADGGWPDCLVLDIHMRGVTGIELQRRLCLRGISFPVVMITADESPVLREETLKLGVFSVLKKPFSDEFFLSTLRTAMGVVRT